MSDYTVTTSFGPKDSLPAGNAAKVIKGTELGTEFTNIAAAIATKANTASPTLTGTPAAPTAAAATNTTQIATTAFVQGEFSATRNAITSKSYGTPEYDAGNSGTAISLDGNNGQNQKVNLTGNVAITLTNPRAGETRKLRIVTHASNTYTVTFSTTVKWPGGTAYTASGSGTKTDFVTLYYDGSAWWGQFAKAFA